MNNTRPIIYFDWDGTLADSMDLCIAECREALLDMGLPNLPDDVIRQCNGPTDQEACAILRVPEEMQEEYVRRRVAAGLRLTPTVNRLFPGVREMLQTLQPVADLAIVSNGQPEYLALCQKVFGLEHVFCQVASYTPGKTKAQLLQTLLNQRGPGKAVMVGDRQGDIMAGRACGLPTVAAAYGYGNPAEYALADAQCPTPQALTAWLYRFATEV